mmetsp:Transcript_122419/g.346082  ORF Transcript_122419/g.346082 Transcript_122419/m.346082 type:complete len:200 (+) Transcript_122419:2028-2627(+)
MTHTVIATVQIDITIAQHGAVGIAPVRQVCARADQLPPHARAEVESENVPIAVDTRATHDVHEIVFDHGLVTVPAARELARGGDVFPLLAAEVEAVHVGGVVRAVCAAPHIQPLLVGHHALAIPRARGILQGIGQQPPTLGLETQLAQVALVRVAEMGARPAEDVHDPRDVVGDRRVRCPPRRPVATGLDLPPTPAIKI